MRNICKLLLLASVCAATGLVQAFEKQSHIVAEPLEAVDWTVIAPPEKGKPVPVAASLTEQQAINLVNTVFSHDKVDATNHAIMVHAVKYQTGKLVAADQNWYTVDLNKTPGLETLGDLHTDARYKDPTHLWSSASWLGLSPHPRSRPRQSG
jgi:hypothetical protein